jgi:signal transduction histidine kinase
LFLPYLLAAALLTALVPAVGLFVFFRRRGQEAESVLTRLRDGDLKARFRIRRLDEVGRTMRTFNAMADEIETLVGRLRAAESRRTQLIRELSHDLRTPLASMSYRVDTLLNGKSPPGADTARGLRAEFDYFVKLVEDLFLLAEADDPAASRIPEEIDPLEWLQESLSMVPFDSATSHRLRLDADLPDAARLVADRQMLRRLLQNAVQNALHFAKREVVLKARVVGDVLELQVRDDGPGFSDEGIDNFGRRRHTRLLEAGGRKKISLGLGSVIIRRVCEMFRGQVQPRNWHRPNGELGGGELRILLPLKFLEEVPDTGRSGAGSVRKVS